MATAQQLQAVAKQLRELQRTSPTDALGLSAWDASARAFTQELCTRYPDISLPAGVLHYLHDADIRVKDAQYRISQDEMLGNIVSDLERGIIPESTCASLSLHPRLLGAAALVLLAALYWVAQR